MRFIARFRVMPRNHALEFHYQRCHLTTWKEPGRCARTVNRYIVSIMSVNYYARPQLGVSDTASWSVEWIF